MHIVKLVDASCGVNDRYEERQPYQDQEGNNQSSGLALDVLYLITQINLLQLLVQVGISCRGHLLDPVVRRRLLQILIAGRSVTLNVFGHLLVLISEVIEQILGVVNEPQYLFDVDVVHLYKDGEQLTEAVGDFEEPVEAEQEAKDDQDNFENANDKDSPLNDVSMGVIGGF